MQYVLDKGQRDDWFSSGGITLAAVVCVASLAGAVIVELRAPEPILDVRLLATRNLAVSFSMMLMLGVVLFGATVLLPLYMQTLMGYTAQEAGMAMSPGALIVILLLPLVGRLLGRVDGRWLIAFGFLAAAGSLLHMSGIYPGIDFRTAVSYRAWLSLGLAFLFVPINTMSFVGVPERKTNQISSIMNLARNVGGSAGISLATTLLARREQFHQSRLVSHATPFDPALRGFLSGMGARLQSRGWSAADAAHRAQAALYGLVQRQAAALAYVDVLHVLAVACAFMALFVLLLRRRPPGAPAAAH
jgi:DHA2 family multidrug resistance protein